MIAFLEGKLSTIQEESLVVNVNGVGYQVFIPVSVANLLPAKGEMVALHIHTAVREDAITLYGFFLEKELALFKLLITVSGIGPKVAVGIIGFLQVSAVKKAIVYEDVSTLKKAPGIGEKTARRMILELKSKIELPLVESEVPMNKLSDEEAQVVEEAVAALLTLGYSRAEAFSTIEQIEQRDDLQVIIRQALKILGQGRNQ